MPAPPVTSRVLPVEAMFRLGAFAPASVQRDYQWRAVHCMTMLNDIDRVFTSSALAPPADVAAHAAAEADADAIEGEQIAAASTDAPAPLDVYMLGAIVLTPPEKERYAIYDGLQRLTTLTILIAVLRDLTGDAALRQRLDALVRRDLGALQMRIVLNGRDTTLANQIQPVGEAVKTRRAPTKTDIGKRVRTAAQSFREKLKPWSTERRDAFARFLLEQVFIDVQEASDARLARQIFVTTNMRGRSLDAIDLFKGQLSDIAATEETAAQVVGHWNGLRTVMGDRLSDFLHAVDFIERATPQGSDCLNALAEHLAATRGPDKIEGFVQGLAVLGADYNALLDVCQGVPTDPFSADIWRLQLFRWPQWRPLALLWLGDYRRARTMTGPGAARKIEAARRRFDALHRRCMGLVLAGFSAADRETIFARAVAQAKTGTNPLSVNGALAFKRVQLSRISDALRLPITDQDTRSMLVRWLESMLAGPVPLAHVRNATVEHILPRRPAPNSNWIEAFDDIDTRYLACHALGNLAAIDRERNETIRNATFSEKRPVFAAAEVDFKTLQGLAHVDVWTPEAIIARTSRMANDVEAMLDLPLSSA